MKVIQIGVGGFGNLWVELLSAYPGVEIVAQVDVDEAALKKAAMLSGVPKKNQYRDLEKALHIENADLLLCVTPPSVHLQQTTMAMQAGLDVIVEKPLAEHIEDAIAIANVSKDTGRLVAVSQNYRFRPESWAMRRLVKNGDIGEIGQVFLNFFKGWYFDADNFRQTMADPLLIDMAIHHFDMLRFITGLNPIAVRGESWNPSWSDNKGDTSLSLTFTLENQARFSYNASWCSQGDFCDWNGNWLIDGDRGSITSSMGKVMVNFAPERYVAESSNLVSFQGPPITNQAYVLADMMAARVEGRQPATNIFDNLHSLNMALSAREAVHYGRKVIIKTEQFPVSG